MKMVKVDNNVIIKKGRGYRGLMSDIEEFIGMDVDTVELVGIKEMYQTARPSSIVANYNASIRRMRVRVRCFSRDGKVYLTRLVDKL